ncbi:MAG: cell wall metabolism sensor histidine kinase WalK [Bacteroidia bacterium]|nr:cell wall metabolism sensor histidine kinase WalK [Bacteroidia bacterium]
MSLFDRIVKDGKTENLSNGFGISMLLTGVILACFVILEYLWYKETITLLVQIAVFFFFSFVSIFVCVEWFVDREQKKKEELKNEEIEQLKSMEVYRREFFAEVSHELRTPIFAVQGFIHTLIDGAVDDPEVRDKFLQKAMKSADRLSDLINDLLIISQIEAREIEMKIRRFHIYDLVLDVMESLEHKLTKKGRVLSFKIESNHHENTVVLADRERIHQVISNLLDNSIKYGNQQGEILVSLKEDSKGKMLVSVTDEGPGIEKEFQEQIFRRFFRVDKSRSREKGGTGLGLSICKHFMEAHGEHIWVESTPGKGTTFTFSLRIVEINQDDYSD